MLHNSKLEQGKETTNQINANNQSTQDCKKKTTYNNQQNNNNHRKTYKTQLVTPGFKTTNSTRTNKHIHTDDLMAQSHEGQETIIIGRDIYKTANQSKDKTETDKQQIQNNQNGTKNRQLTARLWNG